jgi:hypothetical protein
VDCLEEARAGEGHPTPDALVERDGSAREGVGLGYSFSVIVDVDGDACLLIFAAEGRPGDDTRVGDEDDPVCCGPSY